MSDLDGTLLRPDGTISRRTKLALQAAKRDGLRFTVATARPIRDVRSLIDEIGLSDPIICQNGAVIYNPKLRSLLSNTLMPYELVREVVELIRNHRGATLAVDYPWGRIIDPDWPGPYSYSGAQAPLWPIGPDDLPRRRASVVLVRGVTSLPPPHGAICTTSMSGLIEVSRDGAEKGSAVSKVCRMLDIPPQQVVAFGDMPNDAGMIEAAGLGVAMANAHDLAKSVARLVAPENGLDGVARILELLVQGALEIDRKERK